MIKLKSSISEVQETSKAQTPKNSESQVTDFCVKNRILNDSSVMNHCIEIMKILEHKLQV